MKPLHIAAVALAVAALTALPASAASIGGRTIVVVATGSVDVAQPAEWTLGVRMEDRSAGKAMSSARRVMTRVRAALVQAGVPAAQLAVSTTLFPAEQDDPDAAQKFDATKTLGLAAAGAQRAALLIDRATAAGANFFADPILPEGESADVQQRAMSAAVDAARAKAQVLATKTGGTLGDVLDVETGFGYDGIDPSSGKAYATVAVVFEVF